jgi:hypothetical protein
MAPAASTRPVAAAREVLEHRSVRMVDGVLLDLFTANAVVQVADAPSERNRERLDGLPLVRAVELVWRVLA